MVKMLVAICKTDAGKLVCIEIQKNGGSSTIMLDYSKERAYFSARSIKRNDAEEYLDLICCCRDDLYASNPINGEDINPFKGVFSYSYDFDYDLYESMPFVIDGVYTCDDDSPFVNSRKFNKSVDQFMDIAFDESNLPENFDENSFSAPKTIVIEEKDYTLSPERFFSSDEKIMLDENNQICESYHATEQIETIIAENHLLLIIFQMMKIIHLIMKMVKVQTKTIPIIIQAKMKHWIHRKIIAIPIWQIQIQKMSRVKVILLLSQMVLSLIQTMKTICLILMILKSLKLIAQKTILTKIKFLMMSRIVLKQMILI